MPAAALAILFPAASAWADEYDWTGFYAGGHIGQSWVDGRYLVDASDSFITNPIYDFNADAVKFGAIAGYNHVMNGILIGIEADAAIGKADAVFPVINDFDIELEASLRLRLGLPLRRMLPYATLGVAVAEANSHDASGSMPPLGSDSALHLGLAAGLGLEYALTGNIALRGEYLFESFGKSTYHFSNSTDTFNDRAKWDENIVRAAVIWRFDSP